MDRSVNSRISIWYMVWAMSIPCLMSVLISVGLLNTCSFQYLYSKLLGYHGCGMTAPLLRCNTNPDRIVSVCSSIATHAAWLLLLAEK